MAIRFQAGSIFLGLVGAWLACLPLPAATIIFKDGFVISGKVRQPQDLIIDPGSGSSFRIPAGFFYLDDEVRRILFSPSQVQEVSKEDASGKDKLLRLTRPAPSLLGYTGLPSWRIENITPWNNRWERTIQLGTDRGPLDIVQRMTVLTPTHLRIDSLRYEWSPCHLLREFGPDLVRGLLNQYYQDKKDIKDHEKRLIVVNFFFQAGWLDAAQKELDKFLEEYPDQKSATVTYQEALKKQFATVFVEDLLRASKVGQHQEAQEKVAQFFKEDMLGLVSPQQGIAVQELKNKYEAVRGKLKQVEHYLKDLPEKVSFGQRPFFSSVAQVLAKEVNPDTLPRLDTFLVYAQQHDRDFKEKKKPSQSPEEVLSLATTGWVLGDTAAGSDVKAARLLWQVRKLILDYQKEGDDGTRGKQILTWVQNKELTVDVLARIIRLLPPPLSLEQVGTEVIKQEIELPQSSQNGTYYLQLPPGYHHNRAYPVLVLLHGSRERPNILLSRWSALAAQHGYILAAPIWGAGLRPTYNYSSKEHNLVLDCLRDLRRRFQVDSDRVFLFGWEQGGDMAYDVGLSHPDQFAGVLPMSGNPKYFAQRYWPNGQYLPFYVVDGDMNGGNPKANRTLFKDWIRWNYPAMYLEYKGRGSEWFEGELPQMMEWMNRKKRAHPLRELGRYHTASLLGGEEFKTMRHTDNRFYWLSTDAINESCINNQQEWKHRCTPAMLQANIFTGNRLETKAGGDKTANIWNQVNVRTSGVKQVSVWLGADQVDFTKPVLLRVNSQQIGKTALVIPNWQVLVEDFYLQGDRQRLFFARIDVKL